MDNTQAILNEIKQAVMLVDISADVILFGSRARGDYRDESDWDVLVLTDKTADLALKRKIIGNILQVELQHSIGVSVIVRNRLDWEHRHSITFFYKEVEKDGVLL
jgi:predicted nucleotidyltransferase